MTRIFASFSCFSAIKEEKANFLKLQCEKAKNVLGWYPKWGIRQAIEKIVEWEKAVQGGINAAEITDKQIKEYFGA